MERSARSTHLALTLALALALVLALALELSLALALVLALEKFVFVVEKPVLAVILAIAVVVVVPTVTVIFIVAVALAWARIHNLFEIEAATTGLEIETEATGLEIETAATGLKNNAATTGLDTAGKDEYEDEDEDGIHWNNQPKVRVDSDEGYDENDGWSCAKDNDDEKEYENANEGGRDGWGEGKWGNVDGRDVDGDMD